MSNEENSCGGCSCRGDEKKAAVDPAYRRALWIVVILNLGFGIVEAAGGFIAGSQALKADSLDFLGDGSITLVGLLALSWAERTRARVALAQGWFLAALGLGVIGSALARVLSAGVPEAEWMGGLGAAGLLVNIAAAASLMRFREGGDANAKAIWLFSRNDAIVLLVVFFGIIGWSIYSAMRQRQDSLGEEMSAELAEHPLPLKRALLWLAIGLLLLIVSSRILVWGSVSVAQAFGVSDLIIGLTIVALGTSLPELASSIMAARKGESDLALGNIVGSNLFNTLAVVGIAWMIAPITVAEEVLTRDWPVMLAVTFGLFIMAYGFKKQGHLTHWEGSVLLASYVAYTGWLIYVVVG